ncbi:MAG: hypothetical protein ACO3A2_09300 [Bdellovibrionia bacterium]
MGILLSGESPSFSQDQFLDRFVAALSQLSGVPSGAQLIQRALKQWNLQEFSQLTGRLQWGPISKTDTVLTRSFHAQTGQEEQTRQITIYLNPDQSQVDLVLDLAHELVHATEREGFDPYDPSLTAGQYVWTALEGKGGEVDATLVECEVGLELALRFKTRIRRCEAYLSQEKWTNLKTGYPKQEIPEPRSLAGWLDRNQMRRDFYRVGRWKTQVIQQLGSELARFPLLSSHTPALYSSTGETPYPVALLGEYRELNRVACENSKKRMKEVDPGVRGMLQDTSQRPGVWSWVFSPSLLFSDWTRSENQMRTAESRVREFLSKRCQSS